MDFLAVDDCLLGASCVQDALLKQSVIRIDGRMLLEDRRAAATAPRTALMTADDQWTRLMVFRVPRGSDGVEERHGECWK